MPENPRNKNPQVAKDTVNDEMIESLSEAEKRSYYYDDACGYEVFVPDEDDADDEKDATQ